MAKFSVEDGEDAESSRFGSSVRRYKRGRKRPFSSRWDEEDSRTEEEEEAMEVCEEQEEMDGEEEEGEGEEEEEEEKEVSGHENNDGITVKIDPDVLDCSICFEPLCPPLFQCENGHVACASCCTKLLNKCHFCSCPIGQNRCLALEKVMESIKISCSHANSGCKETISYTQRYVHEEICTFAPCYCPIPYCTFQGATGPLSLHFSSKHPDSAKQFQYNRCFKVSLYHRKPFLILHAEDGLLFLLLNNPDVRVGNALSMTCIRPSSQAGDYSYQLVVRKEGSSLQLKALTENTKLWGFVYSSKDFLVVPRDFYCLKKIISVDVCIQKA